MRAVPACVPPGLRPRTELHLYPAVRKHVPHGAAMADKELADYTRAEAILKDLEDLSVDDPRFNDTIAKLKLDVASHVREEEHELFPKLAATLPPETLDELGRQVRRTRQTAPMAIRLSGRRTSPSGTRTRRRPGSVSAVPPSPSVLWSCGRAGPGSPRTGTAPCSGSGKALP
ncbi:hemerythrin domain-containing protein [Streptomyces sp. NPDC055663]